MEIKDKYSLRTVQIPIIKDNTMTILKQENGVISVFYGVTDKEDIEDAKMRVLAKRDEYPEHSDHYPYDFRSDLRIKSKHWSVEPPFNIFTNSERTEITGLISDSDSTWEMVIWWRGIPKDDSFTFKEDASESEYIKFD